MQQACVCKAYFLLGCSSLSFSFFSFDLVKFSAKRAAKRDDVFHISQLLKRFLDSHNLCIFVQAYKRTVGCRPVLLMRFIIMSVILVRVQVKKSVCIYNTSVTFGRLHQCTFIERIFMMKPDGTFYQKRYLVHLTKWVFVMTEKGFIKGITIQLMRLAYGSIWRARDCPPMGI